MRQAVSLVAIGAAVGLVGAVIVSRGMASLLVGVRFTDPVSFGASTALLTLVALAGCYLPARGAIRVDPMVALHG